MSKIGFVRIAIQATKTAKTFPWLAATLLQFMKQQPFLIEWYSQLVQLFAHLAFLFRIRLACFNFIASMDINTAIGLAAAFCTTSSFIPQAIKTIRTRDTSGISASMYTLFTIGTITWTAYGVMTRNTPVIIANVITSVLALVILFYRLRQGKTKC